MKCLKPVEIDGKHFNCGNCLNCRINYTSAWTLRCLYELSQWDCASFITLTYDNDHLPKNGSLVSDETTRFFKRLRKNLNNDTPGRKIKYYCCGEYGTKGKRPHYHAIVFGLDNYSDKDRQILVDSWPYCEPWLFDKNRGRLSAMQNVTKDDIAYVTGYVQKKLKGEMAEKEYTEKGLLPPFSRVSHGMGLDFAIQNKERLLNNGFTFLGKQKISIPRYFCEKFGVKKGDLISDSSPTFSQNDYSVLFKLFEEEMKRKNLWYPENLSMMSIRFERWLNDFNFTYARQIERDFFDKQKIRGNL